MKVAFVYVDAGKGHYVPAKALYDHYLEMGNDGTLDNMFLIVGAPKWNKWVKNWWRANLRHPKAERVLNNFFDGPFIGGCIKFLARNTKRYARNFKSWYEKEKPDYIICTNYLAYPILTTIMKQAGVDIPLFEYVADVFNNQRMGANNIITKIFIASKFGKDNLLKQGIDEDRIIVSPFPLKADVKKFGDKDQKEARRLLNIKTDKFTLILNFGGEGIGNLKLIKEILKNNLDWQMIVLGNLCKKTAKKYDNLKEQYPQLDLITPGYVDNIGLYIKACDVQIGKTGANSFLESLYLKRPFLISELLYTTKAFIDFMEINKVGWAECNTEKQIEILKKYASDEQYRKLFQDDLNNLDITFGCVPLLELADNEYRKHMKINKH